MTQEKNLLCNQLFFWKEPEFIGPNLFLFCHAIFQIFPMFGDFLGVGPCLFPHVKTAIVLKAKNMKKEGESDIANICVLRNRIWSQIKKASGWAWVYTRFADCSCKSHDKNVKRAMVLNATKYVKSFSRLCQNVKSALVSNATKYEKEEII